MDLASSIREAEDRTRWKGVVLTPSGAPTTLQGYRID